MSGPATKGRSHGQVGTTHWTVAARRWIVLMLGAGLLVGCAPDGQRGPDGRLAVEPVHRLHESLVERFVSGLGSGEVDYEPTASPEAAIADADLIVTGTVVDVVPAAEVRNLGEVVSADAPNPVAVVVEVDRVLAGDRSMLDDHQLLPIIALRPSSSAEQLRDLLPDGLELVAVLHVLPVARGDHLATGGAMIDGFDLGGPLLSPMVDATWFQHEADPMMRATYIAAHELRPAWGAPTTIDEFLARLEAALG